MRILCLTTILLAASAAQAQGPLTNTVPVNAAIYARQVVNDAFAGNVTGSYSVATNTATGHAKSEVGPASFQVQSGASQSSSTVMSVGRGMNANAGAGGTANGVATVGLASPSGSHSNANSGSAAAVIR